MKIALVLIHNKSVEQNFAQIEALKSMVSVVEEYIDGSDDAGNIIPQAFKRRVFSLIGLGIPHELEVLHIVPYQPDNSSDPYKAILPANFYDLNTRNVQYGRGDEDKVGNHPRFFNWGLKRGTDSGSEITVYIEDITKFTVAKLKKKVASILDTSDSTEYAEDTFGKVGSRTLLQAVGQLSENNGNPFAEYKGRIAQKGLKHG